MELVNEIAVDAAPERLFEVVSDVERVAGCLPGARIDGRNGDDYTGSMRVKIGPVVARYRGKLRFLELDPAAHRAVIRARADEVDGQGSAEAKILTAIVAADGGSRLTITTDLQIRGRIAQFGHRVIEQISERMFSEFAANLERMISYEPPEQRGPEDHSAASPSDSPRSVAADEGEPLDVLAPLRETLFARALPLMASALIGFGYGFLLGRLRGLR